MPHRRPIREQNVIGDPMACLRKHVGLCTDMLFTDGFLIKDIGLTLIYNNNIFESSFFINFKSIENLREKIMCEKIAKTKFINKK